MQTDEIIITSDETKVMFALFSEYNELKKAEGFDWELYPDFDYYFAEKQPELATRCAEKDRLDEIERQKRDAWEPTRDDIIAAIAEKGWPTFDQIRYDHIDNDEERGRLETAVQTVKEFIKEIRGGAHGMSMIMVANPIDGDMDRTGYGCGKTTLAQMAHYANTHFYYAKGAPNSLTVQTSGIFYSAREIMALFDVPDFSERSTFQRFGKMVVIDDLGREGTLRWEKRDGDMQLQEKQDRYYSIINYCYDNGISMIVTSNLTSREMATFLGGASWSRLLQMVPERYRVNMTGIRDMRPLLADNDWF